MSVSAANAALPDGNSSSNSSGGASWDCCGLHDSFSFTLAKLDKLDLRSTDLAVLSSLVSLLSRFLNLDSARPLPSPGRFSLCVLCCPIPKEPKEPIGDRPALVGAFDQGEEGAPKPDVNGPVVVRFKLPKGVCAFLSSLSASRSAGLLLSLRSVRRRWREGGGDAARCSSRPKPPVGEDSGFCGN